MSDLDLPPQGSHSKQCFEILKSMALEQLCFLMHFNYLSKSFFSKEALAAITCAVGENAETSALGAAEVQEEQDSAVSEGSVGETLSDDMASWGVIWPQSRL